jgi:site-specific DNA recombinase
MENAQKIAAIYARVSTADQREHDYSLSAQRERCLKYAADLGYAVPERFIFLVDYTGTSINRPQLRELRALVRQRVLGAVVVYDLDRLCRNLADQGVLIREMEQHGATLHIVMMPEAGPTITGKLTRNVRGTIAEFERDLIAERTTRGRLNRALSGQAPPGRVPLGYR